MTWELCSSIFQSLRLLKIFIFRSHNVKRWGEVPFRNKIFIPLSITEQCWEDELRWRTVIDDLHVLTWRTSKRISQAWLTWLLINWSTNLMWFFPFCFSLVITIFCIRTKCRIFSSYCVTFFISIPSVNFFYFTFFEWCYFYYRNFKISIFFLFSDFFNTNTN